MALMNQSDLGLAKSKGISEQQILDQLSQFKQGFEPASLAAPATEKNGITDISSQLEGYIDHYEKAEILALKFVPASGAASRMFKQLFEFRADLNQKAKEKGPISQFFKELESFAFYTDLESKFFQVKGSSLKEAQNSDSSYDILDVFLKEEGLNYGKLPKGLLKFHKYGDIAKTPAQEHLTEGLQYSNKQNKIRIHFTVSPEHLEAFKNHIDEAVTSLRGNFEINFSTQKSKTDTIAAAVDNSPFRTGNGDLLFRPAGHGALLENLNDLSADIIFIKNIDNVVPDRLKPDTIRFKKALAGALLQFQAKAFDLLLQNDTGQNVTHEGKLLLAEMGTKGELSPEEVLRKLNRPIRVCGMVKNEGEPGGGPFWVKDKTGTTSLQIVESAQVDLKDKTQENIFNGSTHFNPVDLVCGTKNYKGEKFDLLKYRDLDTGFISEKSSGGQKLKAMELPGLWNGSMADWNTIFVEVPLSTFNPVKTVNDLLKENHR